MTNTRSHTLHMNNFRSAHTEASLIKEDEKKKKKIYIYLTQETVTQQKHKNTLTWQKELKISLSR